MKLRILSSLLTLIFLLSFTACQIRAPQDSSKPFEPNTNAESTPGQDNTSAALENTPSADTGTSQDMQAPSTPDASASDSKISKEEASQIALTHAGLSSEDVSHLYVEYDYDDSLHKYEVQFFHDMFEYDYDIDAQNGTILSFDKDRD